MSKQTKKWIRFILLYLVPELRQIKMFRADGLIKMLFEERIEITLFVNKQRVR